MESFLAVLENQSLAYDDVVIVGDFNCNILIDVSLSTSMALLGLSSPNTTTPTHFTSTSSTLLDLFFISNQFNVLLYDQISAPCFSKHDLLFLTYNFQLHVPAQTITYRDFKNMDPILLQNELYKIDWYQLYNMVSVDDQLSFLELNTLNLFNQTVPLKTKIIRSSKNPWFSSTVKLSIDLRDLAYSRWKKFKTADLHTEYCAARKATRNIIKQAKSKFYADKFSSALGSKKTWQTIREIGIGKDVKNSNQISIDPDAINEKFVNIPMVEADVNYYNNNVNDYDDSSIHKFSFDCVNNIDVLTSCMSIKSNAVGVDEIDPRFLKILLPQILSYVTFIFNRIITTSCFPTKWKYSKIIPLPKTKSDFRPIAILPFLSKAFERIIHNQMICFLNNYNLLTDRQSGFRKKHSCITALTDVAEDIRKDLDARKTNFLILLDHSKAFDTVDHNILCFKLKNMFRFANNATQLISSYLNDRYQYVQSNLARSKLLPVRRGVPQGSIVGPLLFSLYANDLPNQLQYCRVRMYADDVQLYISCDVSNIEQCISTLNEDLQRVNIWATANGLSINPIKSKCLVIQTRLNRRIIIPDVNLNNERIETVKSAKNLGIFFNNTLTWSDHINYACGRTFSMLRTLWSTQHCTPVKIRSLIAKTYLIPILTYGCELFAECDVVSKNKLSSVFKNITRYVYGKKRYDSISTITISKLYGFQFDELLKIRVLIFLHKVVYTMEPAHLYKRLTFSFSDRGKRIIPFPRRYLVSDWQFFINAIRLWNSIPYNIQIISNAQIFKKSIISMFSI